MKNPRNLLLIGLALLLAPIPACAQMICDLNCSLQSAGANDLKVATVANQAASEQRNGSEKHARGTHCDEEGLAASSLQGSGPATSIERACRGDGCSSDRELTVSGASQDTPQTLPAFVPRSVESVILLSDKRSSKTFLPLDRFPMGLHVLPLAGVLRI